MAIMGIYIIYLSEMANLVPEGRYYQVSSQDVRGNLHHLAVMMS